jgi:uncharacterized membrane protein YkoI
MRLPQWVFLLSVLIPVAVLADESSPVELSRLPMAVQKTIHAQVGDGTLDEVDVTNDGSETVYDASLTAKNGNERDFTVAGDGTLLSVEVGLDETPLAVQKTIRAQAPGWGLESIDKNLDDTAISYSVEVTKGGVEKNFTVGDDGTLWSRKIILSNTPLPVQKIIQARLGAGKLTDIDQMFNDDEITYDVETKAIDGTEQSFTVTTNGVMLSEQVTLEKTPPGARRTIADKIGDGQILRIDKSLLERKRGILPYEVEGRKDGKPFDFSVGPRGRFLGMDN